jgi:uncharacterized protein (DUF1800 family)
MPWDLGRVAHLHRRAGFCADWNTLMRDLASGPQAAVDRLLQGESHALDHQGADEFEAFHDRLARQVAASGNVTRLQGHWLYRMVFTPHALRERMVLFWHNHFATSQQKVNNLGFMQRQQETMRRFALGDFRAMLKEMARDPAMLVWLDCATNRKAHPNENYAREVMELFTLGRGQYTERDIQEAARAFTGSFVQGDRYVYVASQHDEGEKTILGRTGKHGPDDVAEILTDHPACALFLARKLYRALISDLDEPASELLAPVAERLASDGYVIASAVEMMIRSRLFFGTAARWQRVKSPVERVVGTVRALEINRPTMSADAMAAACARMGQALYEPPNVSGWETGARWINTSTSLARTNFSLSLVDHAQDDSSGVFRPEELVARHATDRDSLEFYADLLLQDGMSQETRETMRKTVASSGSGQTARTAARLVLTAPEFELA